LSIYPKECKSVYKRDTYVPKFIAAFFTIAKMWRQLRCPTTEEWVKKRKMKLCHLQRNGTGDHHAERGKPR
jgi:hypothetical protein